MDSYQQTSSGTILRRIIFCLPLKGTETLTLEEAGSGKVYVRSTVG
jgi:hypothetical protein